jgi:hypothetical protein
VSIIAGTDPGVVLPHGLIGREVAALHDLGGLPTYAALAAASWRARDWLGFLTPPPLHPPVWILRRPHRVGAARRLNIHDRSTRLCGS